MAAAIPVQNIMPEMLLVSENFKPVKVTSITHGVGELYKVSQSGTGMSYVVNSDHIMTVFKLSEHAMVDIPFKVLKNAVLENKKLSDYFGVRMVMFDGLQQMVFSQLSFTYEGSGEYFGFTLESGCSGRFLLEDNTVTHNTSKMLCKVLDLHYTGYRCCVVRSNKDTRGKNETWSSQCGTSLRGVEALIPVHTTEKLKDIAHECELADVIGIDEGQFFEDLQEFALAMKGAGKFVIIASLDSTFDEQHFGQAHLLEKDSERFRKVCRECKCRRGDAIYNVRKCELTEKIVIGGSDKYEVMCFLCLKELKEKAQTQQHQQK
jgi:thymidine kinase